MSEIVYAVHTRACTYLLDDEGICRWVLSRSGAKSDDRCIGAQFVAALDPQSNGGLIGELRLGSSALFVRSEDGRFVLIRTKPIEHVEIRGAEDGGYEGEPEAEAEPVVLPDRLAVAAVFNAPVSAPAPMPEPAPARVILRDHQTEPPPRFDPTRRHITEPFPAVPSMMDRPSPVMPPPMVDRPSPVMPPPMTQPPQPPQQPQQHLAPVQSPSRSFPKPPAREPARVQKRNEATATQPFPAPSPAVPRGPTPAWPPMLAPPPPQAEMLPLGPARPHLPSTEEIDAADLEEVGDDEQVYSMEVTLTMPLWPGAGHVVHRRP